MCVGNGLCVAYSNGAGKAKAASYTSDLPISVLAVLSDIKTIPSSQSPVQKTSKTPKIFCFLFKFLFALQSKYLNLNTTDILGQMCIVGCLKHPWLIPTACQCHPLASCPQLRQPNVQILSKVPGAGGVTLGREPLFLISSGTGLRSMSLHCCLGGNHQGAVSAL